MAGVEDVITLAVNHDVDAKFFKDGVHIFLSTSIQFEFAQDHSLLLRSLVYGVQKVYVDCVFVFESEFGSRNESGVIDVCLRFLLIIHVGCVVVFFM